MKSVHLKFGVLFLLLALFAVPMMAQNSGTIQGTVVDPQGAVIAGATVQAIDAAKGVVVREATTGAEGLFVLTPLQPGTYNVKVISKGMKELVRSGLQLDSRQVLDVNDLKMAVGNQTENVTVEAVQPLVETGTADHANVISNKQITEISMNGRDFQSLIRTLPGIVSNDASDFRLAFNSTADFHVNGMRGSSNNMFLDGAINTDVGDNGGQFTQLSMDAVGEFKVQTSNFAAEYGRNPGVLLAVNTKSGTNKFHGTLYEFNRQNGFDANYYGNKVNHTTGAAADPIVEAAKLRFHQFGGNLGGPIPVPKMKDKLFFFFNFEGTRAMRPDGSKGTSYAMTDPKWFDGDFSSFYQSGFIAGSAGQCTGLSNAGAAGECRTGQLFMPGTARYNGNTITGGTPIPGNIITPALQAANPSLQNSANWAAFKNLISPLYRAGWSYSTEANQQYVVNVPYQETYRFNKNQRTLRLDWNVNSKTNFFFRWVDDAQKESWDAYPIWSGGLPILPEFRKKPGSSWSWNLVNVVSPSVTNEFIFAYNHVTQLVDTQAPTSRYDKTQLGFTNGEIYPQTNVRNIFPQFNAGYNMQGAPFPPNWGSEGRQFSFTDNITKVAGAHTVKFGAFYNFNRNGQAPWWIEEPSFNFTTNQSSDYRMDTNNGVLNMMLGNYYTVQQANGFFWGKFLFGGLELFGQDSWKVNKKLTLDYGLRWAYMGPTSTIKPFLESYFDPKAYDPNQAVSVYSGPNVFDSFGQPRALNGTICNAVQCPGLASYGNPYNGMVTEGSAGVDKGFVKHRFNNFAPRVGFSYDPTGSGKTAIRGGVGVFYERIRQNVNSFDGLGNPPLMMTPTYYNGKVDSLSVGGNFQGLAGNIRTPDREGQIPTTYSWSIGVQRELPWAMALDVNYVGNRVKHLQYIQDLNQLPVGTSLAADSTPAGTQVIIPAGMKTPGGITSDGTAAFAYTINQGWNPNLPFKGFTQISQTLYGASSQYDGLQAQLKRRFAKSLMLALSYTYSKNSDLSDADDNFTPVRDRFHPKLDWGPTGWDRRNVFQANYVYTLPEFKGSNTAMKYILGGWELTGVVSIASGTPFTAQCGGNTGIVGNVAAPNCDTTGANPYVKSGLQWLNPDAFSRPADGTLGTTTRNEFYGPGFWNLNTSVFKNIKFAERYQLQLRLESFNTFNHHAFGGGAITGLGGAGSAGAHATSGGLLNFGAERDPRMIQLGAKFYF